MSVPMTKEKRGWGEGTVEPNGAGHRVRVRVQGRRIDLGTHPTEAAAEAVRRGFLVAQARGAVPTGELTLEGWGERWLNAREADGVRSIRDDRNRWKNHVARAPFIDWPLRAIERRDVKAWLRGLSQKGLGWQTRKHCLNLLRGCLRTAVDDELLEQNPARGLTVEKPADAVDGWTYLRPEEQTRLATCPAPGRTEEERLHAHGDRLLALIAMGTGLRQGELWNLELRDVHLDDPAGPWLYVRWGSPGKAPKNGKPRRVDLFGIGLAALREWLELLPAYASRNRLKLACPTERGCRRQRNKQPRRWRALLAAAQLATPSSREDRQPVRWHDLRHTCASSLLCGWWGRRWAREEIRDLLGHSSLEQTERYAHLAPSVVTATAAQTPGPNLALGLGPLPADLPVIPGRATHDSNVRPSASEAAGDANDLQSLRAVRANLRAKIEQYLRAVTSRNRFAHRYGAEVAEEALELLDALDRAERAPAAGDELDEAAS